MRTVGIGISLTRLKMKKKSKLRTKKKSNCNSKRKETTDGELLHSYSNKKPALKTCDFCGDRCVSGFRRIGKKWMCKECRNSDII